MLNENEKRNYCVDDAVVGFQFGKSPDQTVFLRLFCFHGSCLRSPMRYDISVYHDDEN